MSEGVFRIPKQTDENLIHALAAIKADMANEINLRISVNLHHGVGFTLVSNKDPTNDKAIEFVVNEHSHVMPKLRLVGPANEDHAAMTITRESKSVTDQVEIRWPDSGQGWLSNIGGEKRSRLFVRLTALARQHLRACDAEATLSGTTESEWSRYRDSQQAILNSLSETQRTSGR